MAWSREAIAWWADMESAVGERTAKLCHALGDEHGESHLHAIRRSSIFGDLDWSRPTIGLSTGSGSSRLQTAVKSLPNLQQCRWFPIGHPSRIVHHHGTCPELT